MSMPPPAHVVLVHNAGADTSSWHGVIDALSAEASCHTVPLAGHRHSSHHGHRLADHRAALLEALQAGPPAIVVGHCVGGAAALSAARVAPELIAALVLISPATVATLNAGPWGRLHRHLQHSPTERLLTRATRLALKTRPGRMLAAQLQVGPWLQRTPAAQHTTQQLADPQTTDRLALLLSDFADFSEGDEPWCPANRPPITLLWGRRNRVLPVAGEALIRQSLKPDISLIIPDAGHLLPLERPLTVAEAIRRSLAPCSSSSRSPC